MCEKERERERDREILEIITRQLGKMLKSLVRSSFSEKRLYKTHPDDE